MSIKYLDMTGLTQFKNKIMALINAKGTYSKPSGGIPKTDLASAVQTSLGKADSALQEHQDISGKQDKLVSGTNIKTINNSSVLGSGNLDVQNGETLPVGSQIDFYGTIIPTGWQEVEDKGKIYSTTEQRTGTWIDNKPIYSKTILLGEITQGTKQHGLKNVDQIADYEPFIFNTENGQNWKLPYRTQTYIDYVGRTSVVVYNSTSWSSNYVLYITIHYTKTTD